jgi:hypothetical protein
MVAVEIVLNEWLFNAIMAREILTLNRDSDAVNKLPARGPRVDPVNPGRSTAARRRCASLDDC